MADLATLNATTLHFAEGSAPTTPDTGEWVIYTKSTGLFVMDDAGTEYGPLAAAGSETLPESIIDAKGDIIVGDGADSAIRLAVGTNDHVLTADSAQASGVKWAAAAGGGGGGWTADLDLDGTTFTGLTSVSGTWASNGTVIQQTSGVDASRTAKATDPVPVGLPLIIQVEMRAPSSGQTVAANMTGGVYINNDIGFGVRWDGGAASPRFVADHIGSSNLLQVNSTGNVYDTFYTIRVLRTGSLYTAYLDGVHMGRFRSELSSALDLGLWTSFGLKADFRNLKIWTITQPA